MYGRPFSFFFSSRRRHTRFDCDWSSDVCSSDLKTILIQTYIMIIVIRNALKFTQQGYVHISLTNVPDQTPSCSDTNCNRADRKSTRLNSSHSQISYAVFCLKKKKKTNTIMCRQM